MASLAPSTVVQQVKGVEARAVQAVAVQVVAGSGSTVLAVGTASCVF